MEEEIFKIAGDILSIRTLKFLFSCIKTQISSSRFWRHIWYRTLLNALQKMQNTIRHNRIVSAMWPRAYSIIYRRPLCIETRIRVHWYRMPISYGTRAFIKLLKFDGIPLSLPSYLHQICWNTVSYFSSQFLFALTSSINDGWRERARHSYCNNLAYIAVYRRCMHNELAFLQ